MASLRLGILAMYLSEKRLEERSFFRKLCIHGKRLGIEPFVFTPDDVDASRQLVHAQYYDPGTGMWRRKWISLPQIVYDRCRYHGVNNYRKIQAFRSRYKLHYISKPLANKWTMHQILLESEKIAPHLPQTVQYRDDKALSRMLKEHRLVYLKPRGGTGGRGIVRIERIGTNTFLLQGRDQQRRIMMPRQVSVRGIVRTLNGFPLAQRYLVQQGIPLKLKDGRVHDYRMLVQKNGSGEWEITGCAGRIGPKRSVTSNLHGGGIAVPMEKLLEGRFPSAKVEQIKREAYRLGLDVAEHLEKRFGSFCEAGIDLAVDPTGHVWLLEVNPKPSREVFYRIGQLSTYRKAITRPLEYALWVHKQGKAKASQAGPFHEFGPADGLS
ncbi:YheC/YheD family protein [Paenibacillus hamazuiensis]|uniref:YheC/YheD family endospore coat-associated protein n=1 Tax=Paenibacillus hamazuiensis TaxID=2936508 RepID=UPI00200F34D0|nr:YheC/YheD family protein [Paenibacillus hamazuiensis]